MSTPLRIIFYNLIIRVTIVDWVLVVFSIVQWLSHFWHFVTQWTAARQASLSITNSWSLLKLMFIMSAMPSNHLILCHPFPSCLQSFPTSGFFSNKSVLPIRWPKDWSFSFSTSPSKEHQDWSPLKWTSWISLQRLLRVSKGLSNTTVQKHQFFGAQVSSQSNSHIHTWPQEKPQPWLDGPLLAK